MRMGGPMDGVLVVGTILLAGFLFGEIARQVGLPKVTGYILAGICLNPRLLPVVPETFPTHTDLVTHICLAFITFSVGGSLLWSRLKALGKTILLITVFEAQCALVAVALGFVVVLTLAGAHGLASLAPGAVIPLSILLATLASPTDPSATLAVMHQYHAKGQVSSTILGVAGLDDCLGIINYSLGIAVAGLFLRQTELSLDTMLLRPLIQIAGGVGVGVALGIVFNLATGLVRRETEGSLIVFVFAMLGVCYGAARTLGVDELLATMSLGCTVVNLNRLQEKIFGMLERYTEELVFVFFFTLSGMHLNVSVVKGVALLVLLFVLLRAAGKMSGAVLGAALAGAPRTLGRRVALGLIPQGGIVIGLAMLIRSKAGLGAASDGLIAIVIGATVIHEIVGPILAKQALRAAGEI